MKTYSELNINQKINQKASMLNQKIAMGDHLFPVIKRLFSDRFESLFTRGYDFVRNVRYYQTGGLIN